MNNVSQTYPNSRVGAESLSLWDCTGQWAASVSTLVLWCHQPTSPIANDANVCNIQRGACSQDEANCKHWIIHRRLGAMTPIFWGFWNMSLYLFCIGWHCCKIQTWVNKNVVLWDVQAGPDSLAHRRWENVRLTFKDLWHISNVPALSSGSKQVSGTWLPKNPDADILTALG